MTIDRKLTIDAYGNTPLHLALLANTTEALSLIEADMKLSKDQSFINVQAQGNTPLLLALKTGNIKAAQAILESPYVDINIPDKAGLRPIHFAAFLRENNVIKILLEKEADLSIASPTESTFFHRYQSALPQMKPSDFYQGKLVPEEELDIPERIHDFSEPIMPKFAVLRINIQITPNFFQAATSKVLRLKNDLIHIPLHALAFQMDLLCANYGINTNEKLIPSWDGQDAPTHVFRENFKKGYKHFQEFRNEIPVDKKVLETLKEKEQAASFQLSKKS